MTDAIVIGSGPNGLTAAAHLARAGWSVRLLEAEAVIGGACRSEASTLPGFTHDTGAGFFPFGPISPAFVPLDLPGAGVVWNYCPYDTCHPAPDGTSVAISRDLERSVDAFGRDGEAWRDLALWHRRSRDVVLPALLNPFPPNPGVVLAMGVDNALTLASLALNSGRGFGEKRFSTDAARRIIPGLALHTDVGPDDPGGAVVGFLLAALASSSGFGFPTGGAGEISRAIAQRLIEHGGSITTGAPVDRIVVRAGRAVAVVTTTGEEIVAERAVLADVAAPALYLNLLAPAHVPSRVRDAMRRFSYGFGTFKLDWALNAPVPWLSAQARASAVVHAGDSVDDLAFFTRQVRAGILPEHPYLVLGQPSLGDATRAPPGEHVLYAYSRVPSQLPGGWAAQREAFADRIEARIEGLAPGFRKTIRARAIASPDDLARGNANLVGGDLGGGTGALTNQLFLRPVFPYFRYRTPVRGLYLASSYAHPGPGVHGMCGYNAAQMALKDVG